ncbi:MAG: hypothetical protein JSR60_13185 [Proteobacteria bacterium]|nr:hypothetical protein [Pseudomonadota bacterium]
MKSIAKVVPLIGLAAIALSGCAYDRHGHGYDGGVRVDYYDGYYDGAYGPFYDGYWGNDGTFWYMDSGHQWRRDDGHHFRHDRPGDHWQHVHGHGSHRDH